ncbi:hypothetical protein BJ741DRAFT_583943 [Chytriomyces cf. hyalinus JEL632]|nr:hypothetical protein BJ741DRAFT_583943 [Chytriomyces cf. hyalinus JEL632]
MGIGVSLILGGDSDSATASASASARRIRQRKKTSLQASSSSTPGVGPGQIMHPPKGFPLSISINNIIMWNPSPSPSSPTYAFHPEGLKFLTSLLQSPLRPTIHLISTVTTPLQTEQITELLRTSGLFSRGLDSRRVLFCDTVLGRVHLVKHLGSFVHFDDDDVVLTALVPHVKRLIRVKRTQGTSVEADKELLRQRRRSLARSVSSSSVGSSVHTTSGTSNSSTPIAQLLPSSRQRGRSPTSSTPKLGAAVSGRHGRIGKKASTRILIEDDDDDDDIDFSNRDDEAEDMSNISRADALRSAGVPADGKNLRLPTLDAVFAASNPSYAAAATASQSANASTSSKGGIHRTTSRASFRDSPTIPGTDGKPVSRVLRKDGASAALDGGAESDGSVGSAAAIPEALKASGCVEFVESVADCSVLQW